MKLEKFCEKKKQKKIIIGAIIGLILLIGGITLYRTFALYEEKKEFDVLKGVIPEFTKEDKRGTLMVHDENQAFWPYRESITKVVFEDTISEKENASYTFDVEEPGSKSVKAYLVAETSDSSKYTLYIQSEDGIIANEDSSSLFDEFTNLEAIEGLEHLDTSNVVYMSAMFNTTALTSLDLSSFDTSKVENMGYMFSDCSNLTSLDISNFTFDSIASEKNEAGWYPKDYLFSSMPFNAKVYVKNEEAKNWILNVRDSNNRIIYPSNWTEANFIIRT